MRFCAGRATTFILSGLIGLLRAVKASAVNELRNIAINLKRDAAAVYAAIEQRWSNGPTEGNVNRLKFLKRQKYGRASFKLLRIRVLLTDR